MKSNKRISRIEPGCIRSRVGLRASVSPWFNSSLLRAQSPEFDVGDAVAGEGGEVDFGGGLAAVPALPEDEALAVGGDAGDEVGAAGDNAEAAVGAAVLGDER